MNPGSRFGNHQLHRRPSGRAIDLTAEKCGCHTFNSLLLFFHKKVSLLGFSAKAFEKSSIPPSQDHHFSGGFVCIAFAVSETWLFVRSSQSRLSSLWLLRLLGV